MLEEALVPLLATAMLVLGFAPLCVPGAKATALQAGLLAVAALARALAAGEAATLLGGVLLAVRAAMLWSEAPGRTAAAPPAGIAWRVGAGLAVVTLAALLLRPVPLPPGLREPMVLALATGLLGLLAAALRSGSQAQRAGLAGLGSSLLLGSLVLAPGLLPWLTIAIATAERALGALRGAGGAWPRLRRP